MWLAEPFLHLEVDVLKQANKQTNGDGNAAIQLLIVKAWHIVVLSCS